MHHAVILLVVASSRKEALTLVREFLEQHRDTMFDWFQIGGRWTGQLAPRDLLSEFNVRVASILKQKPGDVFLPQSAVDEKAADLQQAWESLGLHGKCTYTDHYRLPDDGGFYDVVPLEQVYDVIETEWKCDRKAAADKEWALVMESKAEEDKEPSTNFRMSAYHARIYANHLDGNFCWQSRLYNITETEAETMPERQEAGKYFAVLIDMHD